MLKTEWKKIWIYQRGLPVLLLAVCLQLALSIAVGHDTSNAIRQNESAYAAYIKQWHGEISEQKGSEIEAMYYAVNHNSDPETVPAKAAFMELYDQYTYAKENPARRYLLDERGWNTLLTYDSFPFAFVLCLLALCVPVFCTEYERDMAGLLRSCQNGREQLARRKLLLMAATAAGVSLLMQAVQFAVVLSSCDLSGAEYPLQSLRFFESSPYFMSIGQTYAGVVLLRTVGAVWFAALIALISILAKRTVITVFTGIAASLLPFLLGGSFLKYVLPLPAGMMAGTGYFWGRLTEKQYMDREIRQVVTFRGIAPGELAILLLGFALLLGLTVFLAARFYVGKRKDSRVRGIFCITLVFVLFSLSGYGASGSVDHSYTADYGETARYTIELDRDEGTLTATDRNSGERFLLNRDPFSEPGNILGIQVTENAVTYAKEVTSDKGAGVLLYQVSLSDFSERLIASTLPDNTADFWGLMGEGW